MQHRLNELSRSGYCFAVVLSIALASLLVTTAWAGTGQATPAYYDLAFVIERDGELVGEPRLLVPTGEPAEIRVSPDGKGAGYRLTVVARPASTADGRPAVDVASEFFMREEGSEWQHVADPRIVTEPGKAAALRIGDDAGQSGLFVELTADPVSREAFEQRRREMQAAFKE